jgi:hypothetical protein
MLGGRSARAPPSAAAGWQRLPRPAEIRTRLRKLQSKARYGGVLGTASAWHNTEAAWTGPCCAPDGGSVHAGACGRAARATATPARPAQLHVILGLFCALWLPLGCATRPPGQAEACGVEVHLGGHGVRERLQQTEPADRTIARGRVGGDWRVGAGAAGRTSTRATSRISAIKRGSSCAQSTVLYVQRPLAYTIAR